MVMRAMILTASMLAAACFAVSATEGFAKPKRDKGHKNDTVEAVEDVANALISLADRTVIRDHLRENHRSKCPPGLAKKNNGCLPPGIAKKYAMGKPLPPGIAKKLPGGLLSRLHPMDGYRYAQVDNDVVLVSEATQKIVDAVTLLSAVK